jgi:hypothetical protein
MLNNSMTSNYPNSSAIVNLSCTQCGKEFTRYKSLVRGNPLKQFCSKKCAGEYKRKPPQLCYFCGEEFNSYEQKGRTKFCSRKCMSKQFSLERKTSRKLCIVCNKVVNYIYGEYCSRDCYSYNVRTRQFKVCRICKIEKGIHSFYNWKEGSDGKRTECIDCGNILKYNKRMSRDGVNGEYSKIILMDPCSYCNKHSEEIDHIIPSQWRR